MSQDFFPTAKELEDMMSGGDRHLKFKTTAKGGMEDINPLVQGLAKKPYITVGVHSDTGMHIPEGDGEMPSLTVAEVAFYNEFGTKHIPERSFIRSAMDGKRATHNAFVEKVILQIYAGKMGVAEGMEVVGLYLETAIKKRIDEIEDPANSPATIAGKGSSKPLIDTGQLRRSIVYKVQQGDPK